MEWDDEDRRLVLQISWKKDLERFFRLSVCLCGSVSMHTYACAFASASVCCRLRSSVVVFSHTIYDPGWCVIRRDLRSRRLLRAARDTRESAHSAEEHTARTWLTYDEPGWRKDGWARNSRRASSCLHVANSVVNPATSRRTTRPAGVTNYCVVMRQLSNLFICSSLFTNEW